MKGQFFHTGLQFFKRISKMFEKRDNKQAGDKRETIQEIAIKLAEEQLRTLQLESGPKERTVFVLGSRGAVSKCDEIADGKLLENLCLNHFVVGQIHGAA